MRSKIHGVCIQFTPNVESPVGCRPRMSRPHQHIPSASVTIIKERAHPLARICLYFIYLSCLSLFHSHSLCCLKLEVSAKMHGPRFGNGNLLPLDINSSHSYHHSHQDNWDSFPPAVKRKVRLYFQLHLILSCCY